MIRARNALRLAARPPLRPRRESGAPPQAGAGRGRSRGRRPSLTARSPARAAPAPQVGGDLADGRLLRVLLLVAADLPLHDEAGLRRAARGRESAAFLLERRTLHDLSQGRTLRGPLRRLAADHLADLALRRA